MFAAKGAIGIFTAKANPRPGAFLSVSILRHSGFEGLIALSGLNADHSAASSVPFEDILDFPFSKRAVFIAVYKMVPSRIM